MLNRLGQRVLSFLTFLFALVSGVLLAAGVTVWHLIPKWRREEQEETDRRVAALKDTIRRANEERAAKVDQQVAVVKDQAEAEKAQDTVDLANSLIASAGDK